MKIKFNRYERFAGLFVLFAILVSVIYLCSTAIQQGWFASRVELTTEMHDVEGIYPGTKIQMSGLKVGRVESVNLSENSKILVRFTVLEKYISRVKIDSEIRITRPFVIGEKVLEIQPGGDETKIAAQGAKLPFVAQMDLMELFSGRTIGPYLESMKAVMDNLKVLAEAFQDPKRTQDLIAIFDELRPLVKNATRATAGLDKVAVQLTRNGNLKNVVENLLYTTTEINKSIVELAQFGKNLPELGKDATVVMRNMSVLTTQLNTLIPTIAAIAPELPEASKKALKALDESLVILQAMQKTFLLRSSVAEVKEEQAKEKAAEARKPAADDKDK